MMELNYIDCASNLMEHPCGVHRAISGMFLKDDCLIFVGTLPRAKASSFEVYRLTK